MGDCNVTVTDGVQSTVVIIPSEKTLAVGKSFALTAVVYPTNMKSQNVIWSSGDTSVVTITNMGVITGVMAGVATITAVNCDGVIAYCTVTVGAGGQLTSASDANDGLPRIASGETPQDKASGLLPEVILYKSWRVYPKKDDGVHNPETYFLNFPSDSIPSVVVSSSTDSSIAKVINYGPRNIAKKTMPVKVEVITKKVGGATITLTVKNKSNGIVYTKNSNISVVSVYEPWTPKNNMIVIGTKGTLIRQGPGTNYSALLGLPVTNSVTGLSVNTPVTVIGYINTKDGTPPSTDSTKNTNIWYCVQYGAEQGYIYGPLLGSGATSSTTNNATSDTSWGSKFMNYLYNNIILVFEVAVPVGDTAAKENAYAKVEHADSNGTGLGLLQWSNGRADDLLRKIWDKSTAAERALLPQAVKDRVITSKGSVDKTLVQTNRTGISKFISTTTGKAVQDLIASEDLPSYTKNTYYKKLTNTSDQVRLYYLDLIHHYGAAIGKAPYEGAAGIVEHYCSGVFAGLLLMDLHNGSVAYVKKRYASATQTEQNSQIARQNNLLKAVQAYH